MVDNNIISHVSGSHVPFSKSQDLFRFVDESWFENDNQKFAENTAPAESWQRMAAKFGQSDMIRGEDLKMVLDCKSDFPEKHGGKAEELPAMMFNPHDCDLYDSVRPIRWNDP